MLVGSEKVYPPHARLAGADDAPEEAELAKTFRDAGWDYSGRGSSYAASKGDVAVVSRDHYPYNGTVVVRTHAGWWGVMACWLPMLTAAFAAAATWRRRWRWDGVVMAIVGLIIAPQAFLYVVWVVDATYSDPFAQAEALYSALFMAPGMAMVSRFGFVAAVLRLMWLAWPHLRRPIVVALALAPAITGVIALTVAQVVMRTRERMKAQLAIDSPEVYGHVDAALETGPYGPLLALVWWPGQFVTMIFSVIGAVVVVTVAPVVTRRTRLVLAVVVAVGAAVWYVAVTGSFGLWPVS